MSNPLLDPGELPAFSRISPEIVKPAIEALIAKNRGEIEKLLERTDPCWNNLIDPLALLNDRLDKAWSPVRHLNSVKSSDALRDAYNSCLPLLSEYSTELSQNRALYESYRKISESTAFSDFSAAQQKCITDALLHFRLGGVELEGPDRARYQQLQKELSELQSHFENNLLDATQAW